MKRALLTLLLVISFAGLPGVAYADNPLNQACSNISSSSASPVCESGSSATAQKGPVAVMLKAAKLLAVFSGITAVIIILVGGAMYVTAGGDAKKVETGRNTIMGAVIGLVIVAAAETIVIFVLNQINSR
ncbi:MAG TPA: hypothetical protein VLE99_00585 [Candidatus Saccharimonadales bacterium]|nr:hypothetical protein [Candidatus Saccharimonadales bacterium]